MALFLACYSSTRHFVEMRGDARQDPVLQLRIALSEVAPLHAFAESVGYALAIPAASVDGASIALIDHFRLLQRLSVMGRDETCHLSLRPLTLGTTDFVVETLSGAADLEDAMRRVAKAYNLIHGGAFNRVERRRDRIAYLIDDRHFPYAFDASTGAAHGVMEGVLIFLHAMLSCAVGEDLSGALQAVRSRRPARALIGGLMAFWQAPVRYGAPAYALEYALAAATKPVEPTVGETTRVGDVYENAIAMIERRECHTERGSFLERVIDAIASGATEQPRVARRLGVSVATLRRRLNDESCSFRVLRADVLNRTARSLLDDQRHASDVAETLGFADGRSFARAFKAWNGMTPTVFASLSAPAEPKGDCAL